MTPNYYALLEVAPEAEHEIIRAAYLVLAKRYHPDTATAASPHNDGKFHLITEAYEILRDPDLRAQYDGDHARQKRGLAQREKIDDAHRRAREQAQRKQRERAVRNLLVVVFAIGGFALGALAVGLVKVLAPNSFPANIDLAMDTEIFERSSSLLGDKAAQNQELTDLRQALQQAQAAAATYQESLAQERLNAETLTRDLAAAARTVASEAQAKEVAERSATAQRALQEERARADALARDIDTARRESEALTAAASAASGETTRVREDAMRAAQELQRSEQQERERADASERDLAAVRREVETAERAAAELRHELQEERYKAEKLARELAVAWRELEAQATRLAKTGDNTAQNQELTELRQALQQTERLVATNQELLVQERARNRGLEEQLAARQDAPPARGRTAMASPSETPGPPPATATDKAATAPPPTNDKPVLPAVDWPMTIAARPTAPEAPGNPESARLMARASLLLGQGNIGVARVVLERAAEMGSAPALFALAETYDPAILSAWGTFGTQGDVGKAQELYAKAFTGGIREAKDRLNASRW